MEKFKNGILKFISKYTFWFAMISTLIVFSIIISYTLGYHYGQNSNKISVYKAKNLRNEIKKINKTNLSNLELKLVLQEEKAVGLNKRFDDLYVLGGVILTLVGIILASVYIKTESDVKKHLDETFVKQRETIDKHLSESIKMVESIKTQHDISKSIRNPRDGTNVGGGNVG